MQYKNIFKILFLLISSPAKAWEDISVHWDSQKVIADFVYPMMGFCGIAWFAGSIYRRGWSTPLAFQNAMLDCCGVAVALFGGFFLAAYLINRYLMRWFNMQPDIQRVSVFTGYSFTVIFLINIVTGIVPSLQTAGLIVQLYTFVTVYAGVIPMLKVEVPQRLLFTLGSTIVIIACPTIIQLIYQNLVTILN